MRMRFALLALTLAAVAGPALAGHDGISFTSNMDGDKPILNCDDIDMMFWNNHKGDLVTARRDQSVPLSLSRSTPFHVRASDHGGVRVQRASGSSASAIICMAAGDKTEAAAEAVLDQLRIVNTGGELTVKGPEDEDWAAYLIVSVPNGVALDLEAENGGLGIVGVNGDFTLRTTNGPISIANVSGKVDAQAENGPIQMKGHEGDMRLTAQNGPVGIKIDAPTWSGKGVDASTQNGPVDLTAPEDLRTGVEVKASGYSPLSVNGSAFSRGDGNWGGDRNIRLGDGPVLVHVSSGNGPVNIKGGKLGKPVKRTATKTTEI